jgi:hypothetical protein
MNGLVIHQPSGGCRKSGGRHRWSALPVNIGRACIRPVVARHRRPPRHENSHHWTTVRKPLGTIACCPMIRRPGDLSPTRKGVPDASPPSPSASRALGVRPFSVCCLAPRVAPSAEPAPHIWIPAPRRTLRRHPRRGESALMAGPGERVASPTNSARATGASSGFLLRNGGATTVVTLIFAAPERHPSGGGASPDDCVGVGHGDLRPPLTPNTGRDGRQYAVPSPGSRRAWTSDLRRCPPRRSVPRHRYHRLREGPAGRRDRSPAPVPIAVTTIRDRRCPCDARHGDLARREPGLLGLHRRPLPNIERGLRERGAPDALFSHFTALPLTKRLPRCRNASSTPPTVHTRPRPAVRGGARSPTATS